MKKIETRPDGSTRVSTTFAKPTRTQRQFQETTDINNLMAHYNKTGQLLHTHTKQGQYADLSEIPDLKEAYALVHKADEAFNALPSQLRFKLNNDPRQLFQYLNDPANLEESYKLGLRKRPENEPVPPTVTVQDPPIAKSASASKGKKVVTTVTETVDGE